MGGSASKEAAGGVQANTEGGSFVHRKVRKSDAPHAAVVGAGVVGVSVARALAEVGFNVTVIEKNPDVAMGNTRYDPAIVGEVGALHNFTSSGSYVDDWFKLWKMAFGLAPYSAQTFLSGDSISIMNPFAVEPMPLWRAQVTFYEFLTFMFKKQFMRDFRHRSVVLLEERKFHKTSAVGPTGTHLSRASTIGMDALRSMFPQYLGDVKVNKQCGLTDKGEWALTGKLSPEEVEAEARAEAKAQESREQLLGCVSRGDNDGTVKSVTKHALGGAPLTYTLDPVQWTQRLAKLCKDVYDVKFVFGKEVLSFQYTHADQRNTCVGMLVKDHQNNGKRRIVTYDVVVVAAGADSRALLNCPHSKGMVFDREMAASTPILPVAGYALDVPESFVSPGTSADPGESSGGGWVGRAFAMVRRQRPLADVDYVAPQVDRDGNLVNSLVPDPSATKTVEQLHDATSSSHSSGKAGSPRWLFTGLAALDIRMPTLEQMKTDTTWRKYVGDVFARRLGYYFNDSRTTDALSQRIVEAVAKQESEGGAVDNAHGEEDENAVCCRRYLRGITPDGLPIVSKLYPVENVFLCAGHGDHSTAMAHGSAHFLVNTLLLHKTGPIDQHALSTQRFTWNRVAPRHKSVLIDEREGWFNADRVLLHLHSAEEKLVWWWSDAVNYVMHDVLKSHLYDLPEWTTTFGKTR